MCLFDFSIQRCVIVCFYFKKNQAILPAFGSFTGFARIRPSKGEKVFVIAEGKILDVSPRCEGNLPRDREQIKQFEEVAWV